jgi:transcriptional regulator
MYVPEQFKETRMAVLAQAIRDVQLATLVTAGTDGYRASHIPMIFKQVSGEMFLEGHVARGNDHWRILREPRVSLAVFLGPQTYISPSWYETKREHGKVVPTWNYLAVHVSGPLSAVDDKTWLVSHLNELTDMNEQHQERPWQMNDAPADFLENLLEGIVGLRLKIEEIVGSWKMIQHRKKGDRLGTIAGLIRSADDKNQMVAETMQKLETDRLD